MGTGRLAERTVRAALATLAGVVTDALVQGWPWALGSGGGHLLLAKARSPSLGPAGQ